MKLPLRLSLATAALLPFAASAQVGIGTTTPNAAAALDITSAGKGLLIPRLDSVARVAIANPPTGLMVFQTGGPTAGTRVGFYYYAGSSWLFLPDKGRAGDNLGNHSATQNLVLNNNALQLRTATDANHGLAYGATLDGPDLYGFGGGSLGTFGNGQLQRALTWNTSGVVTTRRRLTVDLDAFSDGTAPTLAFGATTSGEGLASGRTVASGNRYGLDLFTSGISRLSITNGGRVGIGLFNPVSLLANTSLGTVGSDNQGGGASTLAWAVSQGGYAASFYNGGTAATANGLAVKVAGTGSASALDVSSGPTQVGQGTPLLVVKANGNVGVGTNTPTSTLTVDGSLAAAYGSRSASYTLAATDYFVAYNGTTTATFTLPAAQAGTASLQGRVYKLKNNSSLPLSIVPASGESINGAGLTTLVVLAANSVAELISTGATTGATWELVSSGPLVYSTDAIRAALAGSGCASCAAYDAAADNTWVSVAAADYAALQNLGGAAVYGAPALTGTYNASNSANETASQNVVNQGPVPAGAYPYALAVRTSVSTPGTLAGLKLKLSTTATSSGYADWPTAGTATPNGPTPLAASTTYYYVLKRPSVAPSAAAYLAIYGAQVSQYGIAIGTGGNAYSNSGDASTLTITRNGFTPAFQILATPTKQW
jgi:hypothetical protein